MDIQELMKLVNSYVVILIPMTLGITQMVKRALPSAILSKISPIISLLVGVLSSLLVVGLTKQAAIIGIIIGLSASGLWSTAVSPFRKKEKNVKDNI